MNIIAHNEYFSSSNSYIVNNNNKNPESVIKVCQVYARIINSHITQSDFREQIHMYVYVFITALFFISTSITFQKLITMTCHETVSCLALMQLMSKEWELVNADAHYILYILYFFFFILANGWSSLLFRTVEFQNLLIQYIHPLPLMPGLANMVPAGTR